MNIRQALKPVSFEKKEGSRIMLGSATKNDDKRA